MSTGVPCVSPYLSMNNIYFERSQFTQIIIVMSMIEAHYRYSSSNEPRSQDDEPPYHPSRSKFLTTGWRRRCCVTLILIATSSILCHPSNAFSTTSISLLLLPKPNRSRSIIIGAATKKNYSTPNDDNDTDIFLSNFFQGTNEFWKSLVIEPVRQYVSIQPAETIVTSTSNAITKLTSPPEIPGIPRPVWLTILGSVPTGLVYYGYYKFCVEEELYQYELQESGGTKVSGAGGYGTLFPFVFGVLLGFPMSILHIPGGEILLEAAGAWILLGQLNLYKRVNELCVEDEKMMDQLGISGPPLYEWWAVLPPPIDVIVGLRQVHFLSEYWRVKRGYEKEKDIVAEELFPFISMKERFTLKQFFRRPKYWFWFTTNWDDIEFLPFLKD
jgi:hypothetical protein